MRATLTLTRLFARYFARKVLAVGPLQSPFVRLLLAGAGLLLGIAMTFGSALFLRSADATGRELELIVQVSSVSLFFWVLILIIFGRVLFLRSSAFLTFTLQLPVTNRQRMAALAAFEASGVVCAASMLVLPLTLACCWVLGPSALPTLVTGLFFPVIVFYVVLSSLHNALERLLGLLGFGRIACPVVIVLFTVLTAFFNTKIPHFIGQMSGDYLQGRNRLHGFNLFTYVHHRYGLITDLGLFLLSLVCALALLISTTPERPPVARQFLRLGRSPRSMLSLYLAASVRRVESLTVVALAYALALVMVFSHGNYLLCVGMFAVGGLYAHAGTRTLRSLPSRRTRPGREIALLFASQLGFAIVAASPVLLAGLVSEGLRAVAIAAGGLASGCVFTIFLGIQFLPERDNPLAVFLSLAISVGCAGCAAAIVGVLAMPPWLIVLSAIGLHVAAVSFGICGIQSLNRKARHVHA